jgi:tricorn protease
MRLLASILSTVLLCFSGVAEWTARTSNQYALLRKPTVSASQIAFSYGGDAKRLTSDVGIEIDPVFSPGGSMIAFTGEYDGNEDVYVIPATGGIPKRLTSLAGGEAVGWTRDGKRILFRSGRQSYSYFTQLYSVPVTGGLPDQLPLPMAVEGSSSPDSTELAYDFARS